MRHADKDNGSSLKLVQTGSTPPNDRADPEKRPRQGQRADRELVDTDLLDAYSQAVVRVVEVELELHVDLA